jgi:hypothetical protein
MVFILCLYEVCSNIKHIELSAFYYKMKKRIEMWYQKRLTIRCIHLTLLFFFFLYEWYNVMKRKKNGTKKKQALMHSAHIEGRSLVFLLFINIKDSKWILIFFDIEKPF